MQHQTLDSSLVYIRADDSQGLVHDTYRDFFLARALVRQRISVDATRDNPIFEPSLPYFAWLTKHTDLFMCGLISRQRLGLWLPCLAEVSSVDEHTLQYGLESLFPKVTERDSLIGRLIVETAARGKKNLEQYSLTFFRDPALAHYKLGLVYYNIDSYPKAIEEYKIALGLARTKRKQGRLEEALLNIDKAICIWQELDHGEASTHALDEKVEILSAMGRLSDAEKCRAELEHIKGMRKRKDQQNVNR